MMSVFYVEKCLTLSIFRKIGVWLIWYICKMAQKAKNRRVIMRRLFL